MVRIIILKTRKEHLASVVRSRKHAVDGLPRKVTKGDFVLLAQTVDGLAPGQKPIAYAAVYDGGYRDLSGESLALWGKSWRYIIVLQCTVALEQPFAISNVQVSGKNYGQGAVNSVYVDEADAEAIISGGYLQPLVSPNSSN